MTHAIQLSSGEHLPDRPFADPERSAEDLSALRVMRERLRRVLEQPAAWPSGAPPLTLDEPGHRMILARPEALRAPRDVWVVGFFGQRNRAAPDPEVMTAADDALIAEFPQHPEVLSYSSLELPDGNWGNLVLLDGSGGSEHWRTSERHAQAVRDLTPRHYHTIRLHNGQLLGGVLAAGEMTLVRTKYYDFGGAAPWHAVREG